MNDLNPTLILWREIHQRVDRAIINADRYRDGYPNGNGGSGGSFTDSDRTGNIAERHIDKGDRHGDLHRQLERTIHQLADLVDKLAPSNKAAAHAATQADDSCPPGYCESCFRDHGYRKEARTPGSKLCQFCTRWASELNMDEPPLLLVQRHHQGKVITSRDLRIATAGRVQA